MSFFRELHMAAQDLQKSGFNLDTLREEIGNDRREPLPEMPLPTRDAPPSSLAMKEVDHGIKPSETEPEKKTSPKRRLAPDAEKVRTPKKKVEEVRIEKKEAEETKTAKKTQLATSPSHEDSSLSHQSRWTRSKGLEESTTAVGDFLKEQTKKLASAPTKLIAEAEERADMRLHRAKQARDRWEREAAYYAAEAARLAYDARDSAAARGAEAQEIRILREQIAIQRQVAQKSQSERDAATHELEAVALRQVDALQAEVASLRREKKRADALDKELRALKSTTGGEDAGSSLQFHSSLHTSSSSSALSLRKEIHQLKLQLQAARSSAAASARAARGEIEVERQRATNWEHKAASLHNQFVQIEAAADKTKKEIETLRREREVLKSNAKAKNRRDHDSEALKSALKSAMEARHNLESQLEEARAVSQAAIEAKAQSEHKMENDAEMWKGEVAAARQAAREARNALLTNTNTLDPDHIHQTTSIEHNHKSSDTGAAEYLRSVVTTALPLSDSPVLAPGGHSRPDAATRRRLVPVLRSLLALPHETVESSVEALARTPAGGDFALALLSASTHTNTNDIVQSKHAAQLQEQRTKLLQSESMLNQLRSRLDLSESALQDALRAAAKEQASIISTYESQVDESLAIAKRNDTNCAQLAAAADHARAQAAAAQTAQAQFEQKISQLILQRKDGLDANQLDYLRSTLICFLRGFSQPKLRSQLLPVLVQILKLPPDDPRASELLQVTDDLAAA